MLPVHHYTTIVSTSHQHHTCVWVNYSCCRICRRIGFSLVLEEKGDIICLSHILLQSLNSMFTSGGENDQDSKFSAVWLPHKQKPSPGLCIHPQEETTQASKLKPKTRVHQNLWLPAATHMYRPGMTLVSKGLLGSMSAQHIQLSWSRLQPKTNALSTSIWSVQIARYYTVNDRLQTRHQSAWTWQFGIVHLKLQYALKTNVQCLCPPVSGALCHS